MIATSAGKLKTGPLREQVFRRLKDVILEGRYQPGDALREVPLADELGVSQNTVREALLQLEQLGLVVRSPNRNTTVTKLTQSDIRERVSLRMLLEPVVLVAAAERMTEQDYNQLEAKLAAIAAGVDANSPLDTAQADIDFHRFLWDRSGLPFLYQVLDQATLPLFAFVSLLRLRAAENLREVVYPHEEIRDALRSQDHERITHVIRTHLRRSYEEFLGKGMQLLEPL